MPAPAELNPLAQRAALQLREDFITPRMLCGLLRAAEFVVLAGSGLLCWLLVRRSGGEAALDGVWPTLLGAAAGVLFIGLSHGYELSFLRGRASRLWRVVAGCAVAAAVASALLLFLLPSDAANFRGWLMTWFAASSGILVVGRLVLAAYVRRWARNGRMERRAVIVGGGKNAETLIRSLEMQPDGDIRICGIFDDRDDTRSPPIVAGYPKLGTIAELVSFARLTRIDMLIVTLPLSAEKRLLALLKHLWVLPLDIRLSAHSAELKFRPRTYSFVGQIPLIDVFDRPLADWDGIVKRIFDIVIASIAIVALLPVFLVTAIAIRLDSKGPIFFRQKRHGFNNQIVEVFKFRSLYHEMADPEARRSSPRTTSGSRGSAPSSASRRSTNCRSSSTCCRGDLSLVGPRPHAVHAQSSRHETFVEIVDGYFGRHKVKPGITGWAQISGWRGEIDEPEKLKQRFEHDLYYIENWSLLFDIYILVMTPISLLKTNAAY